jgi:hypothetical protein
MLYFLFRFIYCGKIDLTKLQGLEVLKFLIAVDELNIQILIPRVQEYLIKHRHEFLLQNPVELLEMIYQHESFTDLLNYCLEKICDKPEILFNSDKSINLKTPLFEFLLKQENLVERICGEPEILFNYDKFIDLEAPLLEFLLKRDDLSLDEIEIWNSLLKWGLAQNPSISKDITKWSEEENTIMERTLHRFVPLIRLYHISSEDFLDKVYPLKHLLPKDLVDNLFTFYLAPNRISNLDIQQPRQPKDDSILIKRQHFSIFASWIDKKDLHYNKKNIPYNFNLLYRASRDGNTTAAFHAKCDNKGASITIAKITNSEQIVGGYNPLVWDSSQSYKSTADCFIFSFANRTNLQTAKVGYSKSDQDSIACYSEHGPVFGRGNDLRCDCSNWYGYPNSYPNINIPVKFTTEDYEVFQVTKK